MNFSIAELERAVIKTEELLRRLDTSHDHVLALASKPKTQGEQGGGDRGQGGRGSGRKHGGGGRNGNGGRDGAEGWDGSGGRRGGQHAGRVM